MPGVEDVLHYRFRRTRLRLVGIDRNSVREQTCVHVHDIVQVNNFTFLDSKVGAASDRR